MAISESPTRASHLCMRVFIAPPSDAVVETKRTPETARRAAAALGEALRLAPHSVIPHHPSALHYEAHAPERRDVAQRIAVHRDDVRLEPQRDGAEAIPHPQRLGVERR